MSLSYWQVSYHALENSDDYLLVGDSSNDPLQIMLRHELEQEAESFGYDSVSDYLNDHPEIIIQ